MTGARRVLAWAALFALVLTGAVACEAEEADTGPSSAEIENIVRSAVGDQLTASDVQRIVAEFATSSPIRLEPSSPLRTSRGSSMLLPAGS